MDALISVVIPTKDRLDRLWEALKSVGEQTYANVEVVVVSDGGQSVAHLVERYQAIYRRPIQLVALAESQGAATARNAGIAAAQGDLIALLDDDDRFRPAHLAHLVAALVADREAALAYDEVLIHLEAPQASGEFGGVATCRFGRPYEQGIFDVEDYIITSSMLLWRADFERAGGFDETLHICEDWDLLLRLRDEGTLLYVPGEIGVDYSYRLIPSDNQSGIFDARRQAVLDHLSQRYGLPPLVPKTFLDVAHDLGFAIVPTPQREGE